MSLKSLLMRAHRRRISLAANRKDIHSGLHAERMQSKASSEQMRHSRARLSLGVALVVMISMGGVCPSARWPFRHLQRSWGCGCSACHEAWPKLNNPFGQNFRRQAATR